MLHSIDQAYFVEAIPPKPMGKYAHIILVRETQSFPLFQTDGGLNTVHVNAGLQDAQSLIRIMLFKRKQSSPERLVGRELLRRYGLVKGEDCDYNVKFCMQCPDCIYYGFAIGESGSEKSKVFVDTAYSLTGYDESHQQLSFNALYEEGKMTRQGETRSSFGEQDHVLPQVFFPAVITVKDPTESEFLYVLNNIRRTKSYGAQTTRTGKVENHIVGLVFADGEIFSNLKFTQKMYDLLKHDKDKLKTPLNPDEVIQAAVTAMPELLKDDGVVSTMYAADDLDKILAEVNAILADEAQLKEVLKQATQETQQYYNHYIGKEKKK
ncbi:CRISPR-associated protein Csc2 [Candidatus Vecturithrix granuli]|uniref:CRISPR-associated protein Csc2 n=1 Tax=Vecturithrix granuli TaxID=1499967 RepID=A0A081CA94_VECG1|nr:CRISPR-associated protein Csc2 [Candidatus Vecturithrix granuli]